MIGHVARINEEQQQKEDVATYDSFAVRNDRLRVLAEDLRKHFSKPSHQKHALPEDDISFVGVVSDNMQETLRNLAIAPSDAERIAEAKINDVLNKAQSQSFSRIAR